MCNARLWTGPTGDQRGGGCGKGNPTTIFFLKSHDLNDDDDYVTKLCHSKFKTAGAILIDLHGKQHKKDSVKSTIFYDIMQEAYC